MQHFKAVKRLEKYIYIFDSKKQLCEYRDFTYMCVCVCMYIYTQIYKNNVMHVMHVIYAYLYISMYI